MLLKRGGERENKQGESREDTYVLNLMRIRIDPISMRIEWILRMT